MTPEEADAVVNDAMNAIMAKDGVGTEAPSDIANYEELAKIHMANLSDWVVQLSWIVGDQRWDRATNVLIAANQALQMLAGAVSKLQTEPPPEPPP